MGLFGEEVAAFVDGEVGDLGIVLVDDTSEGVFDGAGEFAGVGALGHVWWCWWPGGLFLWVLGVLFPWGCVFLLWLVGASCESVAGVVHAVVVAEVAVGDGFTP